MESVQSTPTITPPPQEIANLPVSGIYKVPSIVITFYGGIDTNVDPG